MRYRKIYSNRIATGKAYVHDVVDKDAVFSTNIDEAFGNALNSLNVFMNILFKEDQRKLPLGMRKKLLLDINTILIPLMAVKKITKKTQKELVKLFKELLSKYSNNKNEQE